MNVTARVNKLITGIPEGTPFKYTELPVKATEYGAAAKAMSRLVKRGVVNRISTGFFYKPKQSVFGPVPPREEMLLRTYMFKDGKRIAYVTGNALYNRMGLTTQVPKLVRVACFEKKINTKIVNLAVKAAKSYVPVTDNNFQFLELLDVLKDFKSIPDTTNKQRVHFMLGQLKRLSKTQQVNLCEIALKYPPRVRALLGSLLNELNPERPVMKLKSSLNPLTNYEYGIEKELLRSINFWRIE